MEMDEAHVDLTMQIKELFLDTYLDHDEADNFENANIDFSNIKLIHKAFAYDVDKWHVMSQDIDVRTNGAGAGETEIHFEAYTDMLQSFKMPSGHAAKQVSLEIPEQFRLPMIGSATGSYPREMVIPHIGEGEFKIKARCPTTGPTGSSLKFKHFKVKGQIVVYTSFAGNVTITGDGESESLKLEEVLSKQLETSHKSGNKYYVSRGVIKIDIIKHVV